MSDEDEIKAYYKNSQKQNVEAIAAAETDTDFIDLSAVPSSDDDEETRLLLEYHSWRYSQPQSNASQPAESSKMQSQRASPPIKRMRIVDLVDRVEIPPLNRKEAPPPLPDIYEAVQEIPGISPRIDCGAHVVFPYDGEVYSKRTQRPMGFLQSNGYLQLELHGRKILLHRYMYEVCYGCTLTSRDMIDHLDHNKLNNSITNLRRTNGSGNNQNRPQPRRRKNEGLPRGVSKSTCERFTAAITVNGKREHLGTFLTAKAASNAYMRAARLANRNHGTNFYLGDQIE